MKSLFAYALNARGFHAGKWLSGLGAVTIVVSVRVLAVFLLDLAVVPLVRSGCYTLPELSAIAVGGMDAQES